MVVYGKTAESRLPFEDALRRVKALLADQGFDVLYEIDAGKTLSETGKPFRPYRIIGACSPQIARAALERDPEIGLLLPFNVVVQEIGGKTVVSTIDARATLSIAGNPALVQLAGLVNARLWSVLDIVYREAASHR